MKRKKKNFKIISLGFLTILMLIFISMRLAYANKEEKKKNLMAGLNQINYQTSLLKEERALVFNKLKKDLDEFKNKKSAGINESNSFYLLKETEFTADELESAIEDTGLRRLGKDFKKAEETYGVNAILLMAMAKHETGNGTSQLFINKNNLFGFNAYDDDPYNKASNYQSPADSINTVAKHLKENYLNPKGTYYKGVSTEAIGKSYATDPDWAKKVNWMMTEVAETMINKFEESTSN